MQFLPATYGKVDKRKECIALYPFTDDEATCKRTYKKPIAYGARDEDSDIFFEIVDRRRAIKNELESLNYLCHRHKSIPPFEYAIYHCGTTSNCAYSNPLWVYFPNGAKEEVGELPARVIMVDGKKYIFRPFPPSEQERGPQKKSCSGDNCKCGVIDAR